MLRMMIMQAQKALLDQIQEEQLGGSILIGMVK